MAIHNAIDYPVELIRRLISEGWTQAKIAEKLQSEVDPRISAKLIAKVCRKNGIKCQRTGPRGGSGHPNWKGGRRVNASGYVEVYGVGHPNQRKHTKYILEHRLVMEEKLGRFLLPSEVVHHLNGVKDDNRPENLQLFSSNAEHLGETLKGCVPKWTPDGKDRIRRANLGRKRTIHPDKIEGFRERGRQLSAIQKALGLRGFPSSEEIARYRESLGKSSAVPS